MYVINLLPFVVGLMILQHRGIRFGIRWPAYAARPHALIIHFAGEAPGMHLGKTLSAYIARHFFFWFCGVFGTMAVVTFLADYIELIRRGGSKVQATLGPVVRNGGSCSRPRLRKMCCRLRSCLERCSPFGG